MYGFDSENPLPCCRMGSGPAGFDQRRGLDGVSTAKPVLRAGRAPRIVIEEMKKAETAGEREWRWEGTGSEQAMLYWALRGRITSCWAASVKGEPGCDRGRPALAERKFTGGEK